MKSMFFHRIAIFCAICAFSNLFLPETLKAQTYLIQITSVPNNQIKPTVASHNLSYGIDLDISVKTPLVRLYKNDIEIDRKAIDFLLGSITFSVTNYRALTAEYKIVVEGKDETNAFVSTESSLTTITYTPGIYIDKGDETFPESSDYESIHFIPPL